MNYLAHAYLSFGHPGILAGNMISDFVKGRKKYDYPGPVQKGIALHRFIDHFTDQHEATRNAKEIFRPAYRLYSGPIMDVLYDHFLATDENEFTDSFLLEFSKTTYQTLDGFRSLMPVPFSIMYPYMKRQNWLFSYREPAGIRQSLGGMGKRAAYLTETDTAFLLFEKHYQLLKDCYRHFWAAAKPAIFNQFETLQDEPGTGL